MKKNATSPLILFLLGLLGLAPVSKISAQVPATAPQVRPGELQIAAATKIIESKGTSIETNYEIFFERGGAYVRMNELDKAKSDFEKGCLIKSLTDRGFLLIPPPLDRDKEEKQLADLQLKIQADTNDFSLLYERSLIYLSLGRNDEAVQDSDRFFQHNSDDSWQVMFVAMVYSCANRPDKAIDCLTHVLNKKPDGALYLLRGETHAKSEQYPEAIADFNQAILLDPRDDDSFACRALAYYSNKQFENALQDFDRASELKPGAAEIFLGRGLADYALKNNVNAANEWLHGLNLLAERHFQTTTNLDFKNEADARRGIQEFDTCILLNPDNANYYLKRGAAYGTLHNFPKSRSDLTEALRLKPSWVQAYYVRGMAYYWDNIYEEAVEDLDHVLRVNPEMEEAVTIRQEALKQMQKAKRAADIAEADARARAQPNNPDVYLARGEAFFAKFDNTNALLDFTRVIQFRPDSATAYLKRGAVYNELHSYPEAFADYGRALQLTPKSEEAFILRAEAFDRNKQYTEAIQDANQAIRLNPGYFAAYYRRGCAYADLKLFDLAVEDLIKAAKGGDAEAMNRLSLCYENGQGTPTNLSLTVTWALQSARTGEMVANGHLRYLAEQGNAEAKNAVLQLRREGVRTDEAYVAAYVQFMETADKTHKEYDRMLAQLKKRKAELDAQDQQILSEIEAGAEAGNPSQMWSMGMICHERTNETQAIYWFTKAARADYPDAQVELRKRGLSW